MDQGKVRIISGSCGGRQLLFPSANGIRPTSGRIREALFSALGSRISFEGCRVLDLFAGSGALGIESLSRGAGAALFVEREPELVKALKKNILAFGLGARSEVAGADVLAWLRRAGSAAVPVPPFDIVFADPPYEAGFAAKLPERLCESGLLRPGGLFFFECGKREKLEGAEDRYEVVLERSSGDTKYFLLQMQAAGEAA